MEEFDLDIASGRLHAKRWGPADAPLLLCLPGLTANLHAFGHIAERVAGPDRQVVALDLRGRGHSDHGPPGSYGTDAHATDVLDAAHALGAGRFDLAGWSLGALVGIVVADRAPERLDSLTLIDHAGRMDPGAIEAVRGAIARLDGTAESAEAYVGAIRDGGVVTPWSESWERHFRYELVHDGDAWRPRTSRAACEEDLDALTSRRFDALWPSITMPAQLLRATVPFGGGLVVPEDQRDGIARAVPHLRVIELDCNHFGALTHPETVAAIAAIT